MFFFWLPDPDLVSLYQLSEGSNPGLFLLLNNERGTVGNFEKIFADLDNLNHHRSVSKRLGLIAAHELIIK